MNDPELFIYETFSSIQGVPARISRAFRVSHQAQFRGHPASLMKKQGIPA